MWNLDLGFGARDFGPRLELKCRELLVLSWALN